MKIFHSKKIIVNPHPNVNTSKGVVRSQELSLCPQEEIKKELKPQGVTEVNTVTIKRDDKIIDANTYIMTFDLPTIPLKIKIGNTTEKGLNNLFPIPSSAINATSTDMTKTNITERVFAKNVENGAPNTLQRNARKLLDVQTVVEIIRCMQKLVKNGKEKKDPVCKI